MTNESLLEQVVTPDTTAYSLVLISGSQRMS